MHESIILLGGGVLKLRDQTDPKTWRRGIFLSLPVGMSLRWVSDLKDRDTVSAVWDIYPGTSVCGVMSVILHKDRCHGHPNIWLVEQTRV